MAALGAVTAVCAQVAGPLEIWVGTGALNALEFLGWSINGATIEESPFIAPIASDDFGGDQGPPADYQVMGYQHRISLELHKYDPAVLAKLELFYNQAALSSASGTAAVGMLLNCTPLTTRLLLCSRTAISTFTYVRNYTAVQILDPIEQSPIGSQATRARLAFVANAKAGVTPWNSTTTTP